MKTLALLSLVLILVASSAYASSVAYVVKNTLYPDHVILNTLTTAGFAVTLIDDNNVASTNFSAYDMILVGDEMYADPAGIPIKTHPSVVMNSYYLDIWGIANDAGTYTIGNNYLRGNILISNTVTYGLTSPIQLYNAYNIPVLTLPKIPSRSRDLDNVVSTTSTDALPILGLMQSGDRQYPAGTATDRLCFYGATKTAYWTADAAELLVRCARYAVLGLDKDGDGYPAEVDCDDNDPTVNPDVCEVPYNGKNDDCNSTTRDNDLDFDGYCKLGTNITDPSVCPLETGTIGTDCNDNISTINPGVAEIPYDSIDQSCRGYDLADVDHDGYCNAGYQIINRTLQCPLETGSVGTDCNDNNASISPGTQDIPYNGIDENCDGKDLVDVDKDGYCQAGYQIKNKTAECNKETGSVGTDCNDNNANVHPGNTEIPYNGLDDDCNPATLENDLDHDGYCKSGSLINDPALCPNDTGNIGTDTNDNNPSIHPNATEIPYNGIDENSDGFDLADVDLDGYCKLGYQIMNRTLQCPKEIGLIGSDCNDNDAALNPAALELPYDGIDNDCSATTLENDLDRDGYCKLGTAITDPSLCPKENGTIGTDCDDTNPAINPGQREIYHNGIDEDCNPATDDNDSTPPEAPVNLVATFSSGKIVLSWNIPQGDPVVYNIYESNTPADFDFSSRIANSTALSWTDDSASTAAQRYYIVRAVDAAANEDNNSYIIGKFNVQLHAGYNLVSSPLLILKPAIADVISGQSVSEIIRYRGGYQNALNSGSWHSDFGFSQLHENEGYFFKTNAAFDFVFTGALSEATQNVQLSPGLNLVGYTRTAPSDFAILPADKSVAEISQYVNQDYEFATFYDALGWFSAENFNELQPGSGYWIKANQATTWSYD